jgi:SAM-dependent methyltransferase
MDLRADHEHASRLYERFRELRFVDLQKLAIGLRDGEEGVSSEPRSVRRFNERYFRIEAQTGDRAGRAILNKLDPHFAERGKGEVTGRRALEAGGANGLFLPDFAKRFSFVVFLDCSLVNLVLARSLADERGLANVAFVRADVMALPFLDEAFDFVHENNVIEHVADPDAMVREAVRVTADGGSYVCVSPNRFSLAPEPHFRLVGFGFIPRPVRRPLIRLLRGATSEEGTEPRSLRQLRTYLRSAGAADVSIYFLPRQLSETALSTPLRRWVLAALALPGIGDLAAWILNGPMLWLMPYHIAVARRERP